jgi:hypothetical protein
MELHLVLGRSLVTAFGLCLMLHGRERIERAGKHMENTQGALMDLTEGHMNAAEVMSLHLHHN